MEETINRVAPSIKQQAIYDLFHNTNYNIIINAVAGSGKTTTLMQLLEQINEKALFLAFNKSIQTEIQEKIDSRGLKMGKALTMHALGLLAIRNWKTTRINNSKNYELVRKLQDDFPEHFGRRKMRWEDKLRASFTLMDMNDVSRMFLTDDYETVVEAMVSIDKSVYEFPGIKEVWEQMLTYRYAAYEENTVEVDFQDMIFLAAHKNLEIPLEPTYLFIDECQDLNLAQHKMINNFIEQGTIRKWVAVGDKNQAIYGFSGASGESFNMFLDKGNVRQMPLDMCYRCPRSVVTEANKVFNVMMPAKREEGKVREINDVSLVKNDSMIVCRNTNPLFQLYFKLLAQNKSCYIKGEEVFAQLKNFMKPYDRDTIHDAKRKIREKIQHLSMKNDEKSRITMYRMKDSFKNFNLLVENLCGEFDKVSFLVNKMERIFVNMDNAIMLCTIHKSKGMEADVVYILDEHLIPSKYAKSPQQVRQEENLKYVARTRAKEELYYLNLDL